MALNPIDKLALLQKAKRDLTILRFQTAGAQQALVDLAPGDIDAQASALYAPMLTAFDAALTRVNNAIAAITPTNADYVAYAQAAEAKARQ